MKSLIAAILLFISVPAFAQVDAVFLTELTPSFDGVGGNVWYGLAGESNPDSVWNVIITSHTYAGVWVQSAIWVTGTSVAAIKASSYSVIGNYKAIVSDVWPYKVAGGLPSGSSGQILKANGAGTLPSYETSVPVANGGTGATTFSGAQNALGFYPVNLAADTATTGQSLIGTPLQFAMGISQTWQFTGWLFVTSSTATGVETGVTVPTGATLVAYSYGGTSAATAFRADSIGASATATGAYATAAGTGGTFILINGTVKTDGTHAGNAVIDFLKATSGTATVKAGSYIIARRVS